MPGKLPARDREVGRRGAIRRAQAPHAVGTQRRRLPATALDELFQLIPFRRAFGEELV
jgi:hypothetical protein